MDFSAIALQGIEQAQVQLEAAVAGLAASGGSSPSGANLDVVDIASQIVALNSAQTLLQLNLSTLKTADQIQKNILDLMA
jgi:flagellin-like hook-associated protein FlgL